MRVTLMPGISEECLVPDPACFHERCQDTDHTCKKCHGYIGCGCGRCEAYQMRTAALSCGAGD